jgi:hypothetical protein
LAASFRSSIACVISACRSASFILVSEVKVRLYTAIRA